MLEGRPTTTPRVVFSIMEKGERCFSACRGTYSHGGKLLWQCDEPLVLRFQHVYLYLGGSQIASRRMPIGVSTSSVIYRHTDALDSSIAATDEAGGVSQTTEQQLRCTVINSELQRL